MERCNRDKDELILAANRELPFIRNAMVLYHIRFCCECRQIYHQHKKISALLKTLPDFHLPDSVLRKIEGKAGIKTGEPSLVEDLLSIMFFNRIKFTGAVSIVAVAIIAVLLFRSELPKSESTRNFQKFSHTEINTANREARQALSLLGKLFDKTRVQLEDEILNKKVSEPLNKGINTVTEIFKEGDTNESN